MSDVHESKEALVGLVVLGKCVASLAADGLDFSDLGSLVAKFVADEKFREVLEAGVKGLDKVPEELKDLEGSEAVELVAAIVDALRSK
jgi:hypothetical protein